MLSKTTPLSKQPLLVLLYTLLYMAFLGSVIQPIPLGALKPRLWRMMRFTEVRAAIRLVVQRHHACNARVFGSVAHGDDQEGSDLYILIDPTLNTSLMDVAKIQVELEKLLGVAVDVLTPMALPDKF